MSETTPRYRVLALDLDGTLTNSQKEISPRTHAALLAAQERGVRLVLASGRPVVGIAPLADRLRLDAYGGYVMAYNGGKIVSWADRGVVSQTTLDPEVLPYLYGCAQRSGFEMLTYDGDVVICEHPDNKYVQYECWLNRMPWRRVDNLLGAIKEAVPKCLIVGDPEPLHSLELEMAEALRGRVEVYRSEAFFLELVPPGIDKAQSLERLLVHLGLSGADLMACGDGYNDLSMIRYAGLGVAMDNAKDEVKAVAGYVTATNDDDGVALAVERFLLS